MDIGVVTKIEEKYMLVMANMGVQKVKPRNNAYVGLKIEYSRKDIYIGFDQFEIRYVLAVLTLISLILFSTIVLFAKDSEDAYAVISVDINPSLELYIDENNVVTGYHTFNDDAKKILNSDVVSLNILEALQAVVISAQEHNYLSKDDFILLSVGFNHEKVEFGDSNNQSNKDTLIEDLVKGFAVNNQEKYRFVYVNGTDNIQHKVKSISLGRQQLATISGLDISEAKEMSVRELVLQTLSNDSINHMRSFEISVDNQGAGEIKAIISEGQDEDDVVNESDSSEAIKDLLKEDEIDKEKTVIIDNSENELEKIETNVEEKEEDNVEEKEEVKVGDKDEANVEDKEEAKVADTEESKIEDKEEAEVKDNEESKVDDEEEVEIEDKVEAEEEDKVEAEEEDKVEAEEEDKEEAEVKDNEESKVDDEEEVEIEDKVEAEEEDKEEVEEDKVEAEEEDKVEVKAEDEVEVKVEDKEEDDDHEDREKTKESRIK